MLSINSSTPQPFGNTFIQDVAPSIPATSSVIPPWAKGNLPHSRESYEKLSLAARTPELDFLILGKVPGGKQGDTGSAPEIGWEFEEVFTYCLKHGELNALDFLWRESGRDANHSVINLTLDNPDAPTVLALDEHCRAYPGLRLHLYVMGAGDTASASLSKLIAHGKVSHLKLHGAKMHADVAAGLAAAMARAGNSLTLIGVRFDEEGAWEFGKSLVDSNALKKLALFKCDFGASQGLPFIQGMQKNRSIVDLKVFEVAVANEVEKDYGALLTKNSTLERLDITGNGREPVDMSSVISCAVGHPSLRTLELRNLETETIIGDVSGLIELVRRGRHLFSLKIDAVFAVDADYVRLTDAIKESTSLQEFSLKRYAMKDSAVAKFIHDTLARNRALSNGEILRQAGYAFDPDCIQANGISDAGSVIARHVLANSSSLAEFANTMAVVELSIRQIEKSGSIMQSPAAQGTAPDTPDRIPTTPSLS